MEPNRKAKGSWGVRFFIAVLGVTLGVLFFWLLTFIENDIGTMKGPQWGAIRRDFVSQEMDDHRGQLQKEVTLLNRKIETLREQQRMLGSSTSSHQNTINQLLSIQQQYIDKDREFPAESMQTLHESRQAFENNQKKNQEYIQQISDLVEQRQQKEDALSDVLESIKSLEDQAKMKYDNLMKKYRLKVAILKMAFLVPVFLIVSFVFMKYRSSAYWALVWAGFIAAFIKLALVAHEYFPSEYFKYIALLVVIGIVIRILVYLIRLIVSPKPDLLIKQYQQHYDKCVCPVCSKPIRTGPLRYIGALHKKARVLAGQADQTLQQEPYTCPSCGTELYDKCDQCDQVRHTLLPYCEHCGAHKSE